MEITMRERNKPINLIYKTLKYSHIFIPILGNTILNLIICAKHSIIKCITKTKTGMCQVLSAIYDRGTIINIIETCVYVLLLG